MPGGVNAGGKRGEDVSDEVRDLFDRPPDWAKIVTIGDLVTNVATFYELSPVVCLAYLYAVSALNPRAAGSWVDDDGNHVSANTEGAHPTAFGIAQLRENVDLGALTPEDAYNPRVGLVVALQNFSVWKHNRGFDGARILLINNLVIAIEDDDLPNHFKIARDANSGVGLPFP